MRRTDEKNWTTPELKVQSAEATAFSEGSGSDGNTGTANVYAPPSI